MLDKYNMNSSRRAGEWTRERERKRETTRESERKSQS
jgi:hypothetical protein